MKVTEPNEYCNNLSSYADLSADFLERKGLSHIVYQNEYFTDGLKVYQFQSNPSCHYSADLS